MHEMSIAESLVTMAREEMAKHQASRLVRVRVRHGVLSGVVADSLVFAFELLVKDTDLEGAFLETVEEPLRLACGACGHEFESGRTSAALFAPCPQCSEDFGHRVLSGKEMFLDQMEIE